MIALRAMDFQSIWFAANEGNEEWLLVHLEVQGHPDKQFPERMFRYYYRIFDLYRRPVTAIAIFTGADGKSMPDRYEHHFLGTSHVYQYSKLCITDHDDGILAESSNPFALVVLAAKQALLAGKIPEQELLDRKLLIVKLLFKEGGFAKKKIEGILTFLNNYLLFESEETNRIFKQQIDQITGKVKTMGIIEQLAEIKVQEEKESFVKRLLVDTQFPSEQIASLAAVPVTFVERVRSSLGSR